jgi:germination protein M
MIVGLATGRLTLVNSNEEEFRMKPYKWMRWAAVTGIAAMITSGCSILGTKDVSQPIDPPPVGTSLDVNGNQAVATTAAPAADQMEITVYAKDAQGFVAPVSIKMPKSESVAKKALEYMVDGGPAKSVLPAGFTGLIPQGTQVKSMNIIKDQKLAVVDFSKQFTDYNSKDERKILEGITWMLTGFSTVDKVQIWVEGKALKEMPQNGMPLDEPLTRAMGINLEKSESVEFGQSTPVTVYFLNQNSQNVKYYVPVTRLVKRTPNIAQAAVEQLIVGPDAKKGLFAVMAPGSELINLNRSDDLITVNFSDKVLGPDKKMSVEAMRAVVLSLTENAGAATKVQIMVNNDAKVTGTDNQSYSKPVSRPVQINQVKM